MCAFLFIAVKSNIMFTVGLNQVRCSTEKAQ